MGISQGLGRISDQVQSGVRLTMWSILTWLLRLLSAAVIGLTVALVAQELMGFGFLAFLFVLVVVTGAVTRILKNWSMMGIVLFDLVCVLVGLGLKMYILLAP